MTIYCVIKNFGTVLEYYLSNAVQDGTRKEKDTGG